MAEETITQQEDIPEVYTDSALLQNRILVERDGIRLGGTVQAIEEQGKRDVYIIGGYETKLTGAEKIGAVHVRAGRVRLKFGDATGAYITHDQDGFPELQFFTGTRTEGSPREQLEGLRSVKDVGVTVPIDTTIPLLEDLPIIIGRAFDQEIFNPNDPVHLKEGHNMVVRTGFRAEGIKNDHEGNMQKVEQVTMFDRTHTLSRRHAILLYSKGWLVVEDLGSKNGTWVKALS